MISHKHKCIFIHIPRTGGTSFEKVFFGGNWWGHEPSTKHILASQAKRIYSDYWDTYFKFAFVRNPWDRCVSLLNFSKMYYGSDGYELTMDKLKWYESKFGIVTVEYDYRFYDRNDVECENHMPGQVYGNFIDVPIDYIGKFENLHDDFEEIKKILGLNKNKLNLPFSAKSTFRGNENYRNYYNDDTKCFVNKIYRNDIVAYGYEF